MLNPLYSDLTYKIRGAIFTVYNQLGFGHKEIIYQRSLEKEFNKLSIKFASYKELNVYYDGEKVGTYKPDFIIDNKVILEIKANEINFSKFERQLLYYLKATGYKLRLIVNFGQEKVIIKRKIWEK